MPRAPIDRFRKLRPRDRVGIGEAFDAVEAPLRDRPVVLKFLPELPDELLEDFETVCLSVEPLKHAAIVPFHGYGVDGNRPYVVIAPPEGRDARAWLDDLNASLTWPDLGDVRAVFDGVCAAVGVAHRMRAVAGAPVLHGMLTPESVRCRRGADGQWTVTVMDFALAQIPRVAWAPESGSLVCDPRAPEEKADPAARSCASDVFSLGVLLATMLVPYPFPMRPVSWGDFVEREPDNVRDLLRSLRGDLPPSLLDEVVRALSPSPDDRHPDADRLRTALRRVAWEPVGEPRPLPRPSELSPWAPVTDASLPMLRLPAALVADLGPAPMHLRATFATRGAAEAPPVAPAMPTAPAMPVAPAVPVAPVTPAPREESDHDATLAGPLDAALGFSEAETTVPSTSAVDALRALRAEGRAHTTPAPRATPPRALPVPPTPPATPPAGDLFATPPAAPVEADATLTEADALDARALRLALDEGTWSEADAQPPPSTDRTHVGRAPERPVMPSVAHVDAPADAPATLPLGTRAPVFDPSPATAPLHTVSPLAATPAALAQPPSPAPWSPPHAPTYGLPAMPPPRSAGGHSPPTLEPVSSPPSMPWRALAVGAFVLTVVALMGILVTR